MAEFTFLNPYWLLGLIAIPFVLLINQKFRAKKSALIAPHLAKMLGKTTQSKPYFTIWGLAWAIACVALAGPSWQSNTRPSFELSQNRMLVLDMSRSMYASDIKPNRLTQTRYKALDLLPKWKEGATGLIAYAGDAYSLSPLTTDASTLAGIIENLSPELMPFQGSNLPAAIELALSQFSQAGANQGDIVVLADDLDDSELARSLNLVKGKNIRVSVLAIGTANGAPIALPDGSLLKTTQGSTVVAKTHLKNLQTLANKTGGMFVPIQHNNRDVDSIAAYTNNTGNNLAAKQNQEIKTDSRLNGGFWLLPLLLLPTVFLFRRGVIWVFVAALLPMTWTPDAQANPFLNADQKAANLYKRGEYEQAKNLFTDPSWQGAASYQTGDYEAAIKAFSNDQSQTGRYNLANSLAQNGQLEDAAEQYKKLLKENPDFEAAKKNLSVVEEKLKQQQQQQQQQQQKSQNSTKQEQGQQSQNQQDAENKKEKQESEHKAKQQKAETEIEKQGEQKKGEPMQAQVQPEKSHQDDPEFRRLEAVESARDPSFLIRAQMQLQAQQKQRPQQSQKEW
ncbi:vWA domain-containing protein [Vibrio parahaemolyticus]|uniref:vWA domain-containing protein n=1 Tax=Vibrio parahaemolyticus TaxID=670 RepID=UPI0025564F65|nr:VWA domain-containing protein [Vibrio parahaemolyticus]MDL2007072.1 VWA domain-containing protein [Vibrio parahaemolyticus]